MSYCERKVVQKEVKSKQFYKWMQFKQKYHANKHFYSNPFNSKLQLNTTKDIKKKTEDTLHKKQQKNTFNRKRFSYLGRWTCGWRRDNCVVRWCWCPLRCDSILWWAWKLHNIRLIKAQNSLTNRKRRDFCYNENCHHHVCGLPALFINKMIRNIRKRGDYLLSIRITLINRFKGKRRLSSYS